MMKPRFWLSLLNLVFSIHFYPSLAALASISVNQSLSGDQTLISKGGIFELGFFKLGNNSSKYYIGIWYKKVSQQTIVWVANRDNPVSDKNTATLKISAGNLILLDESSNQVWSTNMSFPKSNSVSAILLDNGNLILRNRPDDDASDPLWQSFDHQTDTWLPGGKIRLDNKTKQPQYLTSWKNSEDPSTGLFSLELDPEGKKFSLRWNKSQEYWTSGPWNGHIFSGVPETWNYNFSFVSNENESYFTYSMYNDSIISRLVVNISGKIEQYTWLESSNKWTLIWSQPIQQCDVYSFCGAFSICDDNSFPYCTCLSGFEPSSVTDWNQQDHSGGCIRKESLQCYGLQSISGMFVEVPNVALAPQALFSVDEARCRSICLETCPYIAYTYNKNGCAIWSADLMNIRQLSSDDSNGETLYIKLASESSYLGRVTIGDVVRAVVGIGIIRMML